MLPDVLHALPMSWADEKFDGFCDVGANCAEDVIRRAASDVVRADGHRPVRVCRLRALVLLLRAARKSWSRPNREAAITCEHNYAGAGLMSTPQISFACHRSHCETNTAAIIFLKHGFIKTPETKRLCFLDANRHRWLANRCPVMTNYRRSTPNRLVLNKQKNLGGLGRALD